MLVKSSDELFGPLDPLLTWGELLLYSLDLPWVDNLLTWIQKQTNKYKYNLIQSHLHRENNIFTCWHWAINNSLCYFILGKTGCANNRTELDGKKIKSLRIGWDCCWHFACERGQWQHTGEWDRRNKKCRGTECVSMFQCHWSELKGHHEGYQVSPLSLQPCCQGEALLNA